MLKKNSIFRKVIIPVMTVMLLQIFVTTIVLFTNGTVETLIESALESLYKSAENRAISLETAMVSNWSNLSRLDIGVRDAITQYLADKSIPLSDVWGDKDHETAILGEVSGTLIDTMRTNSSTGVFLYFLDPNGLSEEVQERRGLYYRDLDPVTDTIGNSDIQFLRGFVDIARQDNIQLDTLWNENFRFDPQYEELWASFVNPQIAAKLRPDASADDLAYWSRPFYVAESTLIDTNPCIMYTRPLIYDGQLVAMYGTEMQVSKLISYFPAADFDNFGQSGYMLIKFDAEADQESGIITEALTVTGSYIKRMVDTKKAFTLIPAGSANAWTIADHGIEAAQVLFRPLHLYNSNTPFSNEQWALAAIGTDEMLFASSRNVGTGILISTVTALLIGGVILVLAVRSSTKPFITLAGQIERSGKDAPVITSDSDTYEVALLCQTINAMNERRRLAENMVREERERYLVALESAADTFMEYNTENDFLILYYFAEDPKSSESSLQYKQIPLFRAFVTAGDFCHPDDVEELRGFLSPEFVNEPVTLRIKCDVFGHFKSTAQNDKGYYWISLKAKRVRSSDKADNIIGTARDITAEKLAEMEDLENSRRDPTTGFYNRNYGLALIKARLAELAGTDRLLSTAVIYVRVANFDMAEAANGRVFGGIALMGFSRALRSLLGPKDVSVRLSNDEFLIYSGETDRGRIEKLAGTLTRKVSNIYTGDGSDTTPRLVGGTFIPSGDTGINLDAMLKKAVQAAGHAYAAGTLNCFYSDLSEDERAKHKNAGLIGKPVSVILTVEKSSVAGLALELFESASNLKSAVQALFGLIGRQFGLSRIIMLSYDAGFGSSLADYQWHLEGLRDYPQIIENTSYEDFAAFESVLDKDGVLLYGDETILRAPKGASRFLCLIPGEAVRGFCCVMYENGQHIGRILFVSDDPEKAFEAADTSVLHDVTKIISAHLSVEKSHSASRAKSEFLSRVSHEIRTPMSAIIGMTRIAMDSVADPNRLVDSLKKIDFSAKHLLSLINDVLEMSRIESGKLQIEPKPFPLGGLIEGIETLMRFPIENKGLSFTVDTDFKAQIITGDEYRLQQVLVNLLGNANKFTEPGGRIKLGIQELSPAEPGFARFRFAVTDSGIGISEEDQPHVFTAFSQADSGTARRQGTGLGLAISSNIIAAMGGEIKLRSKLGEGSEFYFILNFELPEQDRNSLTESETDDGSLENCFNGKRALLVEDVAINVEIVSYMLEETALQLDTAENGQIAVDMFRNSPANYYDIILMDIQMPVMDGMTAARTIRGSTSRPDSRTVPIIAMTANAFDEDMRKALDSGMNGHIAKPVEQEKLIALLKRLMN